MTKDPILKPMKCTSIYASIMCVSVNEEIETHSYAFTLEPSSTVTLTV